MCTLAASIGLVVGLTAEWGVISGILRSGQAFDLLLVIEAAVVLVIVALLFGSTKQSGAS
jgi:hypothetical protein